MELQANILRFIQSFSVPTLDAFFMIITNFGSQIFYFLLFPYLFWQKDKKLGLYVASSLLLTMYLNVLLKEIIALPRPIDYPGIRSLFTQSALGHSFPSGHAQGSAAIWSMIIKFYNKTSTKILGIVLIFLVSFSRLYLGVHWPLDVIVGILLGLISSLIIYKSIKTFNLPESFLLKLTLSLLPLIFILTFPHKDIGKYMGILSGIWTGSLSEDYFIGYQPKNKGFIRSLGKYFLGFAGSVALYKFVEFVLPLSGIFLIVLYFVLGLWLTLGAPFVFAKLYL